MENPKMENPKMENPKMENPNQQMRELEEAKKYLQKPIRGRFLPTFAMAVAGLGASYCAYRYLHVV